MSTKTTPSDEKWVPVPGFSIYHVSSYGRVLTYGSLLRPGSEPFFSDEKIHRGTTEHVLRRRPRLKTVFDNHGRPHVMLCKRVDGEKTLYNLSVIHIMAAAFFGPWPEGIEPEVINGDKYDTRLENIHFVPYLNPGQKCDRTKKLRKAALDEKRR